MFTLFVTHGLGCHGFRLFIEQNKINHGTNQYKQNRE